MRLFHLLLAWAERPTATSPAETRLHGRWLLLARLLWLAIALFCVALFVASVPIALDVWQRSCPGVICANGGFSVWYVRYLQVHGLSLSATTTFWVVVD